MTPRPLSLRVKWAGAMLVVALVPLAVVAVASVRIQRAGLARAEKELEVAVVGEAAAAIDVMLSDASEATHGVGRALGDARIAAEEVRLEMAEDTLARCDVLSFVAVYDADGALLDAIRHAGGSTKAPPPRLAGDVREGAAGGRWVEETDPAGGIVLRYVEPIRASGAVRGWVVGEVEGGGLSRRMARISEERFGADNRVLVVDSRFRVVAASSTGALRPGRDLRGQDIFAAMAWNGENWAKDFGLTTEFEDAEHVRMVGTVRTLPERHWAVVARRPESEAFAALDAARRAFAVAFAAVGAFSVAVGLLLARRTTAPIAALVALTRSYARRDFAARSTVTTGDELEQLGASMGEMATSLAASEVEIARRAAVEAGLSRYLPEEVAKAIADGRSKLELDGERKEVSIVFADVAAFTAFSERTPPEQVVRFLNELFSILSEVVFRHGGMVDKFMGDCIMAVFTEPTGDGRGHCQRAVAAAEDMHRFVESQAATWRRDYDFDVQLGIGVASGPALVGNLGSDQRMEYTAIGDTVNVAARLETLARPGQTLVTAAVSEGASQAFQFNALGAQAIRGKAEPIQLLELAT